MPGSEIMGTIRAVIEWAALAIEILGAVVIVAGVIKVAITRGTVRYLFQLDKPGRFERYKHQMGRSLLLGLEFLVAGDVVRTVAARAHPDQRGGPRVAGADPHLPELVAGGRD